jgi:hypothetical protein
MRSITAARAGATLLVACLSSLSASAHADEDVAPRTDKEEQRRPNVIWVQPEIGSSYTNLKVFYSRDAAFAKTSDGGLLVGVSLGGTIPLTGAHAITFGAFTRVHAVSGYNARQLGGLAGYRWGRGATGAFVHVMVAPLWVDTFDTSSMSPSTTASAGDLALNGFTGGLHGGFDLGLTSWFSIGVALGIDVLSWSRAPLPVPAAVTGAVANDPLYTRDGKGTGLILSSSLRIGFSFF